MKRVYAVILICFSVMVCVLASCISRSASGGAGESASAYCTVTFYKDDRILQQSAVPYGGLVADAPDGTIWCDASGRSADFATLAVTQDLEFYEQQPATVRSGHVRYMDDREDNKFEPSALVTRGEAAEIFCKLLENEPADNGMQVSYSDVPQTSEEFDSVELLSSLGVMSGYYDGSFRPDEPITRAEMVTSLCRLLGVDEMPALAFPDVDAEYWAMGSVAASTANGWLTGYEDGEFYPDEPVTRAEAVVMINRARGRSPNKTAIDLVCPVSPYRDISHKYWAYYDIVDVSFSSELLAYIMGEVPDAEPGVILIGDDLCHVNAEKKLDYFQKGFHTFTDGKETDGLYYAPNNGYFLLRCQPGLMELDGSMFYVETADGPFAVNYQLGYLYFGENGRYTSGDAAVDGYVDALMADIIQGSTTSLLNEGKLREAYNKIVFGGFDYMVRNTGWKRGTTHWTLGVARVMYETKRGTCFYWAAAFMYLARRLGYQAYPVVGGVNENNAAHAWVMIDEGGNEYIYDVEMDWAYRTGAHGRVPIRPGRDLFKQLRGHAVITYIFPGDTFYAPPSDYTDALGGTADDIEEDDPGAAGSEGVDFVTSYVVNGDGTVTVTRTYLTGPLAGTTETYTISEQEYNGMAPTQPTEPDPQNPGGETNPGGDVTNPGGETTNPGGETTNPGGETTNPGGETTTPGGETNPGGNTGGETTTPGGSETNPGGSTGGEAPPPSTGGDTGGGTGGDTGGGLDPTNPGLDPTVTTATDDTGA